MTSFIISKMLIFGVPILLMGTLQFLRFKVKISANIMESIFSLILAFSFSYIFGFEFTYPSETVDFIPWFAVFFSIFSLINHERVKIILCIALSSFMGWVIFNPLLFDFPIIYIEWLFLITGSVASMTYSGKLKNSLRYDFLRSLAALSLGAYIFLAGSISIGQSILVVSFVEITRIILERYLKNERSNFKLFFPCLLIGAFEFLNYGF